jgi:hypothetical protein
MRAFPARVKNGRVVLAEPIDQSGEFDGAFCG